MILHLALVPGFEERYHVDIMIFLDQKEAFRALEFQPHPLFLESTGSRFVIKCHLRMMWSSKNGQFFKLLFSIASFPQTLLG